MAFTEFEKKKYEMIVSEFIKKRRPPLHVRDKVDLNFRIEEQSVEIFEIRPMWQNPEKKIESAIAKATFVRTQKLWNVYWQRADLKWHSYEPEPEVKELEDFIYLVETDEYACFWG